MQYRRGAGGRRPRRAAAALAALALGVFAFAGHAFAAPAMWVARDADSQIYLFGTMHLLSPGADWRTPVFDAVYREAEAVWFETDVDADPAFVRQMLVRYGVDPERRLTEKLSPRAVRRLKPLLDKARIPVETADSLRPWAAAMMLSVRPLASRGAKVSNGADAVITKAARTAAKPVRTFETFEEQVRLFAEMPEQVEVQYLEDILAQRAGVTADARTLEQAWLDGDLLLLAEELVHDLRESRPALYDVMLRRRNRAWAETLTQEMAGSGVQLVNVGALHMIGRDGLPAMLQARGFAVERVQ